MCWHKDIGYHVRIGWDKYIFQLMNEKMIVPGGLKYLCLVYSSVINMIIFPSCYGIFSSRHDYLLSNPRDFLKSRGFIEIGKELIAAVILG